MVITAIIAVGCAKQKLAATSLIALKLRMIFKKKFKL